MIEVTVLNYLKSKLNVPVYMEKPSYPPPKYVLIEKTGSGRSNKIDSSTFAFQSYANSMYEAAELNELVKQAVDASIENDEITRATLNSDYNFTDTTTKQYRYQAVYDITNY